MIHGYNVVFDDDDTDSSDCGLDPNLIKVLLEIHQSRKWYFENLKLKEYAQLVLAYKQAKLKSEPIDTAQPSSDSDTSKDGPTDDPSVVCSVPSSQDETEDGIPVVIYVDSVAQSPDINDDYLQRIVVGNPDKNEHNTGRTGSTPEEQSCSVIDLWINDKLPKNTCYSSLPLLIVPTLRKVTKSDPKSGSSVVTDEFRWRTETSNDQIEKLTSLIDGIPDRIKEELAQFDANFPKTPECKWQELNSWANYCYDKEDEIRTAWRKQRSEWEQEILRINDRARHITFLSQYQYKGDELKISGTRGFEGLLPALLDGEVWYIGWTSPPDNPSFSLPANPEQQAVDMLRREIVMCENGYNKLPKKIAIIGSCHLSEVVKLINLITDEVPKTKDIPMIALTTADDTKARIRNYRSSDLHRTLDWITLSENNGIVVEL
ncbi:MAG: hypothetical protein LBJ92_01035 [Holosporales bacterium]|jgi:hypothetical protein|nr:hypothetical protein [Holosporales bacterium]